MFQQVYLHKATRSAEWMIRRALARAAERMVEAIASRRSRARIELAAHGEPMPLHDYLELDDAGIGVAMHAWERRRRPARWRTSASGSATGASSRRSSSSASRPSARGREEALARAREVASARGLDPDVYVGHRLR